MATTSGVTSTGTTTATASTTTNPNGILGKDDFLKLLLLELKYQDPTSPMDTEKILAQTSQLATLESTENTNKSLETLANSLTSSMQYSSISAIGKIADTGSNAVVFEKGKTSDFEIYFPENVQNGSVNILDVNGNTIKNIPMEAMNSGVHAFQWNGSNNAGDTVKDGTYYVESSYTDSNGQTLKTRVGTYPIESVRFDNGVASVKMGSNYVPFSSIKEIVGG
ncbi:MAG: flagellar hook capping FlgD N-terminal domain-containing protein [Sulfuricurvum sp.]|nr:flagellar hook capping FlgD N-terminal domain-containing protein [Sulfuricurvum sp.]